MSHFSRRLSSLRTETNVTLEKISESINIDKSTLSRYETGDRSPKVEIVEKLADYFNVSVDYLLGKTDYKKTVLKFNPKKLTEIRGKRTFHEFSKTVEKVSGGIPLSPFLIEQYEKGNAEPPDFILHQIALSENVSVDYFYNNENKKFQKKSSGDNFIDISYMDKDIREWIKNKNNYIYIKYIYNLYKEGLVPPKKQ
jgi:transcriptional regulator with XRE-family HTH domain